MSREMITGDFVSRCRSRFIALGGLGYLWSLLVKNVVQPQSLAGDPTFFRADVQLLRSLLLEPEIDWMQANLKLRPPYSTVSYDSDTGKRVPFGKPKKTIGKQLQDLYQLVDITGASSQPANNKTEPVVVTRREVSVYPDEAVNSAFTWFLDVEARVKLSSRPMNWTEIGVAYLSLGAIYDVLRAFRLAYPSAIQPNLWGRGHLCYSLMALTSILIRESGGVLTDDTDDKRLQAMTKEFDTDGSSQTGLFTFRNKNPYLKSVLEVLKGVGVLPLPDESVNTLRHLGGKPAWFQYLLSNSANRVRLHNPPAVTLAHFAPVKELSPYMRKLAEKSGVSELTAELYAGNPARLPLWDKGQRCIVIDQRRIAKNRTVDSWRQRVRDFETQARARIEIQNQRPESYTFNN